MPSNEETSTTDPIKTSATRFDIKIERAEGYGPIIQTNITRDVLRLWVDSWFTDDYAVRLFIEAAK